MLENKLHLDTIQLNGFRESITQPLVYKLKVVDFKGKTHSLKIPKQSHEDLLCLFSLIAASHYTDKAIYDAIDNLIVREYLIQCESLETYESGCKTKVNQSIKEFCEKYELPLGNLLYLSGHHTFQCKYFRSSMNLPKSEHTNEYFVTVFTWFMTLMFGEQTLKQYVSKARTHINPDIRYIFKNNRVERLTA